MAKILLVDDEPDILRATKVRLMSFGYDIITADDGKDVIDIIKREAPDLVLLDLWLPHTSGDEICVRLKSDDKLKCIPVIMFTASSNFDIDNKVKEIGADGYIIKPFTSDDLLCTIKRFIS